jgi:acyl-[acyl-carrier-protein] desaturase
MASGSYSDNYDVTAKQNATTERSAGARLDRTTEDRLYQLYRDFFRSGDADRAWNLWLDLPWDALTVRPDTELTAAVVSAYRDELFLPDISARTLAATRSSRGRAWFVTRWTYDEGKHLLALNEWLTRSGAVDTDELRARSDDLLGQLAWESPSEDALAIFVEALLWERREIGRYEALARMADAAGEDVLSALCRRVLGDESAHEAFFRDSLRIIAESYPDRVRQAVRSVTDLIVNEEDGRAAADVTHLLADIGVEPSGV